MIKVKSKIIPADDGLDVEIEVMVAYPKSIPEGMENLLLKGELMELLKNVYRKKPELVLDALEDLTEVLSHDKTDIDNN